MKVKIKTNIIYDLLSNSNKRITVCQGGTRSGKTYNILIYFVVKLLTETGKVFTICRESLPSIKGSVLRDFIKILNELQLFVDQDYNKTEQIYNLNGNLIEFVSIDQPHKIRGRKRDYLFINEANELTYEDWMQLIFRTTTKAVIDYNPSDEYSWIYDDVIPREDADFYITTYKDNPFLPQDLINEIERLKEVDENYWKIYGLGQRGQSSETIYTHWTVCKELPNKGEIIYGQDFGYNVASALIKIELYENSIYCQQLLYETRLTTSDLIEKYKILGLNSYDEIFCDAAEPKTIEELCRAGYNAKPADKDVTEGIRKVKSMKLFVTDDSVDTIKELRNYKWKIDKNGKVLDEPVKFNDHSCDGIRYGVFTKLSVAQLTWVAM